MIRAATKRLVRSVYVMRCGYCLLSEAEIGAELTFDHFQPQSTGGSDNAENLVYACHACNEFKGEYWGNTDDTRLLHPLRDDLTLHVQDQPDGTLLGISPLGELYIGQLQLNRLPLVSHRRNQQRILRFQEHYLSIDSRLERILTRIERIERRDKPQ
jgi:hypothetical protein